MQRELRNEPRMFLDSNRESLVALLSFKPNKLLKLSRIAKRYFLCKPATHVAGHWKEKDMNGELLEISPSTALITVVGIR